MKQRGPYEIVVLGTSYGGLSALQEVLPGLAPDFALPIVVVQHRKKDSDDGLCEFLEGRCPLPLGEPNDKDPILGGRVYLAPRDYHLLVEAGHFALSIDSAVAFARPSIDVLFSSAADAYGPRAVCVVLTGANRDGAEGAARVKSRGGLVVVQDPETAVSRAMPDAAIAAAGGADHVLPLGRLAHLLNGLSQATTTTTAAGGSYAG